LEEKKPKCKSKDDQAKHLQGWTTNPINANWKKKSSITKKTIKLRPMMWVLSMKEEKYKEIPSQNIVMHKSGPMQKEF